MVLPEEAIHRW